jgi:hypothetical protein
LALFYVEGCLHLEESAQLVSFIHSPRIQESGALSQNLGTGNFPWVKKTAGDANRPPYEF